MKWALNMERGSVTVRRFNPRLAGLGVHWLLVAWVVDPVSAAEGAGGDRPPATAVSPDASGPNPADATSPPLAGDPSGPVRQGAELTAFGAAERGELDAYIDLVREEFGVPGVAVAVIEAGRIGFVGTYGVREKGHTARVDSDTRFMIGSISKSMTTAVAATLVAEGRLDWEQPVQDLLPSLELSNAAWSPLLTLAQAFSHTSGVPRADTRLFLEYLSPVELVQSLVTVPALAPPGGRYEYQNQVFAVGGYALAAAAGAPQESRALERSYAELLERRLFRPLAMTRSTVRTEEALRDRNHASPHAFDPGPGEVTTLPTAFEGFAEQIAPAGGIWSTIEDMARYFTVQLREGRGPRGGQVLPAAELRVTHTPITNLEEGVGYGLGWARSETPLGVSLGHDGGTAGFSARVLGLPEVDWGIVILANQSGAGPFMDAVSNYVTELALRLPHAGHTTLLQASIASDEGLVAELARTTPASSEEARELVGRYERDVRVTFTAGELELRTALGVTRLRHHPDLPGVFVIVEPPLVGATVAFQRGEGGSPQQLTLGLPNLATGETLQPVSAALIRSSADHRGLRWPAWQRPPLHTEPLSDEPLPRGFRSPWDGGPSLLRRNEECPRPPWR